MKAKKIFFVWAFLCAIVAQSQGHPTPEIYDNTLQNVFTNLEKDRIPNGLLLDAAIEFANLKKYDGSMPDSSYTSSKVVVDIYSTLLMSKLSTSANIPKTSEMFVNDWKYAQQPDVITLGGLFYQYAEFSDATQQNAQNTGDPGTLIVSNGQIQDKYINGVWQNPYQEKRVFAIAPAVNTHNKFNFSIALPDNLFLSNLSSQIQKIEYKLSDAQPYQILPQNQIINASYTAEGTYHWTFKLTLNNNEVLYSHTQFKIDGNLDKYVDASSLASKNNVLSQYQKVQIEPYTIPGPFPWSPSINKAKATMYIELAPGHNEIINPLIVAEGFDMGNIVAPSREAGLTNIDGFINSLRYENFDNTLRNFISSNYDIIYVDWGNGVDYIQNNAALLKQAIQYVNDNKSGTEQNVILGQSMGGLVARYALKDMEDLGQNHDSKLFISHDSPHLGANIPLGLQSMLVHVSKTYVKTPVAGLAETIVPVFNQGVSVNDVLTLTDTPAARQMLFNYMNKSYQIDNSIHNNWQNELKLKGYPQQTRNVAIANGSECGTDQTLEDLLRLYKETDKQHLFSDVIGSLIGVATGRLDMVLLASLPGSSKYVFDFTVRPMTLLNQSKQLYKGNIKYKKKVLWLINSQVTLLNGSRDQPAGFLPIDKYGGGRFVLAQDELPDYIRDNMVTTPFGFIPTPSALDLYSGNQPLTENEYQRAFSPVDDASIVPFDNFVAERMDENNVHISFSPRNGQFILNQLSDNSTTQNQTITTAYLCGSKIKIGGEDVLCSTNQATYTTGFAPSIQWSVIAGANLININGATNLPQITFTPVANSKGLVRLQALLTGGGSSNTVTKDIWIGKPATGVFQINDPSFYHISKFDLKTSSSIGSSIPLSTQGITNVKWTKISSNPSTGVHLFASEGSTSGWAQGPNNSWTMNVKVEVTNSCGTHTFNTILTPPAAAPCDDNYILAQTSSGTDTYNVLPPPDPCNQSNVASSTNTMSANSSINSTEQLQITVANNLGTIVISKTGNSFDLTGKPTGTYVVNVSKNGTTVLSQTLIKN